MSLYQHRVLPLLIHLTMRQRKLASYRQRIVPLARGRVLEIGVGSGLNLPYYGAAVEHLIGLDPSPKLLGFAREAARRSRHSIELIEGSAETIPLFNRSIDTIVTTWTMCSIPDIRRALGELRRVLRPDGRLLFVEHGKAPDPSVGRWQNAVTPFWRCLSGGCHLNRSIDQLIRNAGFRLDQLETGYMSRPKMMTYMFEGAASPA